VKKALCLFLLFFILFFLFIDSNRVTAGVLVGEKRYEVYLLFCYGIDHRGC